MKSESNGNFSGPGNTSEGTLIVPAPGDELPPGFLEACAADGCGDVRRRLRVAEKSPSPFFAWVAPTCQCQRPGASGSASC